MQRHGKCARGRNGRVYTMYPPWSSGRSRCLYTRKICNRDNGWRWASRLRETRLARVVFWRQSKGVGNKRRTEEMGKTRGRPIQNWNITAQPNMYKGHGEIYILVSIRVHTRAHKYAALKCTPNAVGRLQWRRRRARNEAQSPDEARNCCERD